MNKISVDINNNQIMTLTQGKHDEEMILHFGHPNVHVIGGDTWTITQGDFVMLMNYYRSQKEKGEPIF